MTKRAKKGKQIARPKVATPSSHAVAARAEVAPLPSPPPTETYDALAARARAAQDGTAWAEAAALWADARGHYPDELSAYDEGLICLAQSGQPEAREALFGEAATRFPTHEYFSREHAWMAHHRGALDVALERWQIYKQRFPESPFVFLGRAATLNAAGRGMEADACIEAGLQLHPDNREMLAALAFHARDRGDVTAACARWARVRSAFPHDPLGYLFGGWQLRDAGLTTEALAVFKAGTERFPDHEHLAQGYAGLIG